MPPPLPRCGPHVPPPPGRWGLSGSSSRSPERTRRARRDGQTHRHTDSPSRADNPRPDPFFPRARGRFLPESTFRASARRRPRLAQTASGGERRAPARRASAASGALTAPSALDCQPSSRRLIAPRGSDVSPGIGQSQAPIQIPAPFPRLAPPCLTMASAFTASAPRG